MLKKSINLIILIIYIFTFGLVGVGCNNKNNSMKKISSFTTEVVENFINIFGRTYYNENLGGLALLNGASGFEVKFYGAKLTMNAQALGSDVSMFSVFVDGETDSNKKIVEVTRFPNFCEITLVDNLEKGEHTVKVLKRTHSLTSACFVKSVETDGHFLKKPQEKQLKIEFYGDSITNGSGILRNVTYDESTKTYYDDNVYTPQTQNALQSYASVASNILDAEMRIYGRGGVAMKYSPSSESTMINNPNSVTVDDKIEYDVSLWHPDIVVIYLGTNDYCLGLSNKTLNYSSEGLASAFIQFIDNVIKVNYGKDTPIILCYGMMVPESGLDTVMINVKNTLKSKYTIDVCGFEACAKGHPIVSENAIAGELLANKIKEILNIKG